MSALLVKRAFEWGSAEPHRLVEETVSVEVAEVCGGCCVCVTESFCVVLLFVPPPPNLSVQPDYKTSEASCSPAMLKIIV